MSRGLSAPNVTASAALHVRPIYFVELVFDTGTVRVHNGVGTFTWGGNSWLGIGSLGEVGPIEESLALSPFSLSLSLTAFDPVLTADAISEELYGRASRIYSGLLDDNGQLVADPHQRWGGTMDHVTVRLGGDDRIELVCENGFKFLDRANGALFTDEDQQRRYAGDLFFEFLDQMIDLRVQWGP